MKYFKLENLQNSTKELSEYLNIKVSKFPHINRNNRNISESKYKLFYDSTQRNIVREMYSNDIKMFDYEF